MSLRRKIIGAAARVGWLVRRPAMGPSGCLRVPLHRRGVRRRRSARCVPARIVAFFPQRHAPDRSVAAGSGSPSGSSATRLASKL